MGTADSMGTEYRRLMFAVRQLEKYKADWVWLDKIAHINHQKVTVYAVGIPKEIREKLQNVALKVKQVRNVPKVERIYRECLKCGKSFLAEGKENRICISCKGMNKNM